jgi:hypothetical protein
MEKAEADDEKPKTKPKPKPKTAAEPTLPTSGFSGKVTIGADAGKAEATLLSAQAIRIAAREIAHAVKGASRRKSRSDEDEPEPRIFIYLGADAPRFDALQAFDLQVRLLTGPIAETARDMDAAAGRALKRAGTPPKAGVATEDRRASALALAGPFLPSPLLAAGATLDALGKFGSFLQSDYDVGGVAVTADEALLGAAVAGELAAQMPGRVILPSLARAPAAADALTGSLGPAAALSTHAHGRIAALTQASAGADKTAATVCAAAIGAWRAVAAAHDALIQGLATPDDKGVRPIAELLRQEALRRMFGKTDLLLHVQLSAAVGGYMAERNLWTFLTGLPFQAMGGAVVSHEMMDGDGAVITAGVTPVHSGYARLTDARALLEQARRHR